MKRRIMSVRREYAIDLTITLKLLESTSLIKLISSLYLLKISPTLLTSKKATFFSVIDAK